MSLYEIILAIQQASGKNAKRDVLREHQHNFLLQDYLKAVYDPRIQYGIKKLPKPSRSNGGLFGRIDIEQAIERLAGRQLTGKKATQWVLVMLEDMDEPGQQLFTMMLDRDIRAGIAENSILEIWPDLFFIPPYQRCASMDPDLKARFGEMPFFYVQTKSDGQFCYAIKHSDGEAKAMSRAGSLYPDWLAQHITYGLPKGNVAMGELLVVREGKVMSRKDGNGVLNSVLSGDGSKFLETDSVRFIAWDIVYEEEFRAGSSDREYRERWNDLINITALARIESWPVKSVKEADEIQRAHTARGEEGTVWKSPKMLWRDCSSGDKDMMKAKTVFEADYRICGWYEGKGKAAGMLGGFDMETSDGLIKFSVGSGFSDAQRREIWANGPDMYVGKIAACEGNDIVTSKGKETESIFLPIFIEVREDKKEADSRARVWEQFNAAKEGQAA